ncbi:primosomal protein N', partial [Acinetobacter guillouiae]
PYNLLARIWKLLDLNAEDKVKRSENQQEAYKILKLHPKGTQENILNLSGVETATLKVLEKKDIFRCDLEPQNVTPEPVQLAQMPITPNDDQK